MVRKRLMQECEKAKENLGQGKEARVFLHDLTGDKDLEVKIESEKFQLLANSLPGLSDLEGEVRKVLKAGGYNEDGSNISEVLLVGGCSRINFIREKLS